MKIGILTYHWVYNFGANLQTLSTIGYLRKRGHTPIVINWIPEDSKAYYDKTTDLEMIKIFREFQSSHYPLSRLCRNSKDVADVIKEESIEKVFLGADTLFMLRKDSYDRKTKTIRKATSDTVFPNPFWGEFLNYIDVPIVGYSIATLSTNPNDFPEYAEDASRYLKRFNKLTVRDSHTQQLVSGLTKGALVPDITPDPVFGFNDNIDISITEKEVMKKFDMPEKYYLLCMPEPYNIRLQKWANTLAAEMKKDGITLYELPRQTGNRCFDISQLKYSKINPLEWYILIKNSAGYIGGLMHPIVTCIHNKVPFYCLDYYGLPPKIFGKSIRGVGRILVNPETSKTYQIVKDCGLLQYYFNVKNKLVAFPSAKTVYKELKNYNIVQLNSASEEKKDNYVKTVDVAVK